MDTWNAQMTSFNNYPQEYVPSYQIDPGARYYKEEPNPISRPEEQEYYLTQEIRDELSRRKLAQKREKNRLASARYRKKKDDLLAKLESEMERVEKVVEELEAMLQRGLEELAELKSQVSGGCRIVLAEEKDYAEL